MSAANGSAQTQDAVESKGKGKGKATEDPVDQNMEEDDDDTSDEDEVNPPSTLCLFLSCAALVLTFSSRATVSQPRATQRTAHACVLFPAQLTDHVSFFSSAAAAVAEDDDNMDEIDTNNIVEGGRRTRGKVINWAQAAKDIPGDDEDDEEEDDDFEAGGEDEDENMED
jgi:cation transport ATPase